MLIVVSIFGITGCAFTVKNTDGLALAYKDIDRASSYASALKSMGGIPEESKNEAKDLYIQAKAEFVSYLQKAITDASDYEVDNPKEEYMAIKATAKVDAFENKVKELRDTSVSIKALPPLIAAGVANIVIETIWDLNQKAREEGRKKFEETVTKYMMKNYEEILSAQGADR